MQVAIKSQCRSRTQAFRSYTSVYGCHQLVISLWFVIDCHWLWVWYLTALCIHNLFNDKSLRVCDQTCKLSTANILYALSTEKERLCLSSFTRLCIPLLAKYSWWLVYALAPRNTNACSDNSSFKLCVKCLLLSYIPWEGVYQQCLIFTQSNNARSAALQMHCAHMGVFGSFLVNNVIIICRLHVRKNSLLATENHNMYIIMICRTLFWCPKV